MKGTYTIIVTCNSDAYCTFGRLGRCKLRKGLYVYTGSAQGSGSTSLERRIERHKKHSKKKRWHIDYLTSMQNCRVTGAIWEISARRLECEINGNISRDLNLPPLLPKIGAGDCRCEGHLLGPEVQLSNEALLRRICRIYYANSRTSRKGTVRSTRLHET